MSLLEIRALSVRFGGLTAVSRVDFAVDAGSLVALIGPNGAGKTTAFNVITGVYAPSEGSVAFDGARDRRPARRTRSPRAASRARSRTSACSAACRRSRTCARRCRARGARGAARRAARRRAGARARTTRSARRARCSTSSGSARFADARADSLPYGEQRRLEIARALATEPKLLLLDEPAAGMNPAEKQALRELIRRLRREHGLTIVLIDHDVSFVMNLCERVAVLDHGEKIADGPPEAVRRDPA